MENRQDFKSIAPFLPPLLQSPPNLTLSWPPQVAQALESLSKGPHHSNVATGESFFAAISHLRDSLGISSDRLAYSASQAYTLFFDELMPRVKAEKWFGEIIPALASLLLRFPSLLEAHYQDADKGNTGLRLLESQEAGIVFLSQELISALLTCSLFCLFPTTNRSEKHLRSINFDYLFACLCPSYSQKQESKIMCLVHYFEKICLCKPTGFVSFERKVLQMIENHQCVSYPKSTFWSESKMSLCHFSVCHSGLIEDQLCDGLEVDFANRYLGGGALSKGCVQEEIRFMINPELIVGRLFLPAMDDNEAIEIVGAERFSNYSGYASTFRFSGDYLDKKSKDCMGRRKTRIVAIDAFRRPQMKQYGIEGLVRETNKAFCGFFNQSKHQHQKDFQDGGDSHVETTEEMHESPSVTEGQSGEANRPEGSGTLHNECINIYSNSIEDIGIITGNWGCGAFGGDVQLKVILQWLAASQASRPFILYCTFEEAALQHMDQVVTYFLSDGWTVGDVWNLLLEYSSQRIKGETRVGFFKWLLPDLKH